MRRLDKRWFRAWLERQAPGTLFERGNGAACPIARYIRAATGGWATVHRYRIHYGTSTQAGSFPPPAWAKRFIDVVDRPGTGASRIRARTALRILDEVTAA